MRRELVRPYFLIGNKRGPPDALSEEEHRAHQRIANSPAALVVRVEVQLVAGAVRSAVSPPLRLRVARDEKCNHEMGGGSGAEGVGVGLAWNIGSLTCKLKRISAHKGGGRAGVVGEVGRIGRVRSVGKGRAGEGRVGKGTREVISRLRRSRRLREGSDRLLVQQRQRTVQAVTRWR